MPPKELSLFQHGPALHKHSVKRKYRDGIAPSASSLAAEPCTILSARERKKQQRRARIRGAADAPTISVVQRAVRRLQRYDECSSQVSQ